MSIVSGKFRPICSRRLKKPRYNKSRFAPQVKQQSLIAANPAALCWTSAARSRTRPHVCASRRQLPAPAAAADFRAPLSFCGRKQRGAFCDNESDLPDTGCERASAFLVCGASCLVGRPPAGRTRPKSHLAPRRRREESALVSAISAGRTCCICRETANAFLRPPLSPAAQHRASELAMFTPRVSCLYHKLLVFIF
jgi:hypothetical protein